MLEPNLIFEDENYLVLNKPAGWFSIPAREPKPEDLVLSQWLAKKAGLEPWIVHRLDRFTSGVILFAKNREAHRQANQWFHERTVKKTYSFLASPPPSKPAIQVKKALDGKAAQTLFEVMKKSEVAFYGRATPLTGRFHQIREHAREAGFPLLGDRKYGGALIVNRNHIETVIPRVCLHAAELTLPFGAFQAPTPEDFETLIRQLIS